MVGFGLAVIDCIGPELDVGDRFVPGRELGVVQIIMYIIEKIAVAVIGWPHDRRSLCTLFDPTGFYGEPADGSYVVVYSCVIRKNVEYRVCAHCRQH